MPLTINGLKRTNQRPRKELTGSLRGLVRGLWRAIDWLVVLLGLVWSFGALWFDFPNATWRHPSAFLFLGAALAALLFVRPRWRTKLGILIVIGFIAGWWLTLKPDDNRDWQADVARTGWAEIDGDEVTLHNVRNCSYRTETDYMPEWETRTVQLSQLTGLDLAIIHWGSPLMAHPIVSFRFANALPVSFSIEARKVVGQDFSALASLYRQCQLICIVADERDVLRLRAVYRRGENVRLYRTLLPAEQVRARFLEYLNTLNELHAQPRWYNVFTTNCTTSIRAQRPANERLPWDWRLLVNGKGDKMMYERHLIATGGLPFLELKRQSQINERARAVDHDPDFSRRIRGELPGFAASPLPSHDN